LQQGEMIIVAARPSMGKTSFALNLAEQIALGTDGPRQARSQREPLPIGVFSLEMSKSALVQRLLSSYTGINSQHIQRSILGATQYDELLLAAERLAEATLFIDDSSALSVTQLRARARRMVAKHQVRCIMIDYLQLLSAPGAAKESRQVEVGAISRGVKALARDLKIPIICLSQLNRGAETRDQNKPRLSDLRESGSLEQDADVVMLLHREEYYHIGDQEWLDNNPDKVGLGEVIIAKQRNGPTGTVRLSWNASTTRFLNHAAGADESGFGAASRQDYAPTPPPPPPPASRPPSRAASYVEPAGTPPPAAARPSFGAFAPGRQTGPVRNHRDGGGPERDAEGRSQMPPALRSDGPAGGEHSDEQDEGPAPF
ncbi:MAG: DnaB-like helicase C-terminal domain-containing protein, partial [Phycisphaerales bacterium]